MQQSKIPLISIIVPIYKAEKCIHICIKSILSQTYPNIEVILVDDGSPDNCGVICDEYALNDNRVKVIHQKNLGVTAARSAGIKVSTGNWITFIDADDSFYDESVLEKLLQKAIVDKTDIVLGASLDTYPDGKSTININKIGSGIYDSMEYVKILLTEQCIYGPACKIIKKKLFNDEIFQLSKLIYQHEDMFMNIILGLSVNKISIDNNIIAYNYTVSSSTSFQKSKGLMPFEAWTELFVIIKKIFIKKNIYNNLLSEYSQYAHKYIYLSMLTRQSIFPYYKELNLPTNNFFEKKIRFLNKFPILWLLYFQIWRVTYILKNILK